MSKTFKNIADIVNSKTGKTWRQENMEKVHNIPLGALVEVEADLDQNGLRLWVVSHDRDCDETPLYSLSFSKDWSEDMFGSSSRMKFAARAMTDSGHPEESLKIIK